MIFKIIVFEYVYITDEIRRTKIVGKKNQNKTREESMVIGYVYIHDEAHNSLLRNEFILIFSIRNITNSNMKQ